MKKPAHTASTSIMILQRLTGKRFKSYKNREPPTGMIKQQFQ